jgi:DNA-binding NtrC family response regulator
MSIGRKSSGSGLMPGNETGVSEADSARVGKIPPGASVLVVDDEPLIRWSLRKGLSSRGYQVAEAETGAQALDLLRADPRRFSVVILDYRLPDRQDLSLLSDVRRLAPDSAVWMMTAYGDAEMRAGAIALGARAVVDKPFQVHAFIERIATSSH